MKQTIRLMVVIAILAFGATSAFALSSYVTTFNSTYPAAAATLGDCVLCHIDPNGGGTRNGYGEAFRTNGHNFKTIEPLDSDGDGFTNIAEIQALTWPGDATSHPVAAADTTPPTVTAFTVPATATSMMIPITTFTAADNVGVTGYIITESATAPTANSAGWSATAPTTYTTMAAGAHTLYAYAKDAAGNISTSKSASVTVTMVAAPNRSIIWRNTSTGANMFWNMNGALWSGGYSALQTVAPGTGWDIKAVADFNGDGQPDLLWRNSSTGQNTVWFMSGSTWTGNSAQITTVTPATGWDIVAVGDFNGDGKPDILWRNSTTGDVNVWLMNGTTYTSGVNIGNVADQNWKIAGVADFNGGGQVDILWRNASTGQNIVWYMNGTTWTGQSAAITTVTAAGWNIAGVADFNGDGQADILWRNSSTGQNIVWYMNGPTWTGQTAAVSTVSDPNWKVAGIE